MTESNDFMENELQEQRQRPRRQSKPQGDYICPLCQLTIKSSGLQAHLNVEAAKLQTMVHKRNRKMSASANGFQRDASTSSFQNSLSVLRDKTKVSDPDAFETYKSVKINRLCRIQSNFWKSKEAGENTICPVCAEIVVMSSALELQTHIEKCINNECDSDSSEVEVEGDEYEWAGIKKVRITSLMHSSGQLDALGTRVTQGNEDENVDVCLDDEELEKLGPPQYDEEDLKRLQEELSLPENDSSINSNSPGGTLEASNPMETESNCSLSDGNHESSTSRNSHGQSEIGSCSSHGHVEKNPIVLQALKDKIVDLEQKNTFICQICRAPYNTPLVSLVCWHVHCEACWLRTLATKKLCPQCKVIVCPTDLRKIFL